MARLLGGARHPANTGGRVDVASARFVAQCKNVRAMSLAQIEALAVELQGLGERVGKVGLVVLKRFGRPRSIDPDAGRADGPSLAGAREPGAESCI